jgi:hypothetical protein
MTEQTPALPPIKIAFILDGVVQDVLHTDSRLGAVMLSEPTIVDVTEWYEANPDKNLMKATYDGTTFVPLDPPIVITPNA